MKYDISKPSSPKMKSLGKGTECIKILLKQVSKDIYEQLIPLFFPIFRAHICGAEFQYTDHIWRETCDRRPSWWAIRKEIFSF